MMQVNEDSNGSIEQLLEENNNLKSDSGFEDLIGSNEGEQNLNNLQVLNDHNLFELVGVLVHSGSANSGHYYSYIKERDGQGRWLEFNDTKVTEFKINELADKCYGSKKQNPQPQQWQQFHYESNANAYLLFYSRINKNNKQELKSNANEGLSNLVPKDQMFRQIWAENDAFIKMNHFLDFDYFQFVWDFVSLGKSLFKHSSSEALSTQKH